MERTALQETEILPQGDRLPANHPPAFDGPISGPGVWRGSDLQNTDEWKYVLSSAEKKDLLKATAKAAAEFENIQDIKKSDFELPILCFCRFMLRRDHPLFHKQWPLFIREY